MFDENSKVNSSNSLDYTNGLLNIIYITQTDYLRYLTNKRNTIPGGFKKKNLKKFFYLHHVIIPLISQVNNIV